MREKNFLEMAQSNLLAARKLLEIRASSDDHIINLAAYHVQQCAELCLKYMLEEEGVFITKTHRIGELLDNYFDIYSSLEEEFWGELDLARDTLTGLETQTRYIKNFFASVRTVEKMSSLVKKLLDYAYKRYVKRDTLKINIKNGSANSEFVEQDSQVKQTAIKRLNFFD